MVKAKEKVPTRAMVKTRRRRMVRSTRVRRAMMTTRRSMARSKWKEVA